MRTEARNIEREGDDVDTGKYIYIYMYLYKERSGGETRVKREKTEMMR